MAVLIKTNGSTVTDVRPSNGKAFGLEQLRQLVGCEWVEFVYLSNGIMVIDEEGKVGPDGPKPYNAQATALALEDRAIGHDDYIVGDALVCDTTEIE